MPNTNIIRIEEKRDGVRYTGEPDPSLYLQEEERELAATIDVAKQEVVDTLLAVVGPYLAPFAYDQVDKEDV